MHHVNTIVCDADIRCCCYSTSIERNSRSSAQLCTLFDNIELAAVLPSTIIIQHLIYLHISWMWMGLKHRRNHARVCKQYGNEYKSRGMCHIHSTLSQNKQLINWLCSQYLLYYLSKKNIYIYSHVTCSIKDFIN